MKETADMKLITALKLIDPGRENLHAVTEEEGKRLQALLLEMLIDISDICRENKIRWSLSGGGVLGAVRHQGFIPWDDDLDLNMTRTEFEKFQRVFPGRLSDKYSLLIPGDRGYLFHTPMIQRKGTVFTGLMPADGVSNGVFIDIFIMENVSDNKLLYTLHGIGCMAAYAMQSMVRIYKCRKLLLEHTKHYPDIRRTIILRSFLGRILSVCPVDFWGRLVYNTFSWIKDDHTRRVSIPSGGNHYFGETYERKKVCLYRGCRFEGKYMPIPKDADYYLTRRYGSTYMTLPPEHERMRHVVVDFDLGDLEGTQGWN